MKHKFLSYQETFKGIHYLCKCIKKDLEKKNLDIQDVEIIISCRWGEIIWTLVKNYFNLTEDHVSRIKFDKRNNEVYVKDYSENLLDNIIDEQQNYNDTHVIYIDDMIDHDFNNNDDNQSIISFLEKRVRNIHYFSLSSVQYPKQDNITSIFQVDKDTYVHLPWEEFFN